MDTKNLLLSYEEKDWFCGLWGVAARIPAYTE